MNGQNSLGRQRPSASLGKLVSTDGWSYLALMVLSCAVFIPLVMWAGGWMDQEEWPEVLATVVPLSIAATAFLRHRKRQTNRLLQTGALVPARIIEYSARRDIDLVKVAYSWQGRRLERTLCVSRRMEGLQKDSKITLAVDPHEQRSVVIVELYE